MKTAILLAVAALVTVGSAQLQPDQLYQQTPPDVLLKEAGTLDRFPESFGSWRFQKEGVEIAPAVQEELGWVDYVSRIYRNAETGQEVGLLLMLGQPGPLVRHPPDICYSNRGSRTLNTDAIDIESHGQQHHFRSLAYVSQNVLEQQNQFVVAYAHTAETQWDVPQLPRLVYGGEPFLYKMQVLVAEGDDLQGRYDTASAFLADYVDAFRTARGDVP